MHLFPSLALISLHKLLKICFPKFAGFTCPIEKINLPIFGDTDCLLLVGIQLVLQIERSTAYFAVNMFDFRFDVESQFLTFPHVITTAISLRSDASS